MTDKEKALQELLRLIADNPDLADRRRSFADIKTW